MIKELIFIFTLGIGVHSIAQSSDNTHLVNLAKAYKDYMFRNEPDKKYLKNFTQQYPDSLQTEAKFIRQTISSRNKLLDNDYLTLPDESVLKNIYIISEVNSILRKESDITPFELVDSLIQTQIPRYELVDNYYGMLFVGVGNKNQPFNFSKNDFVPDNYGLNDDVEKGIFFLRCMDLCGTNIWGFMNIVNPPNTKKALAYIKKYPEFNGKPYYEYTDLYFKDFEMVILKDKGIQSYKSYYIDKYYELLLSHLICLGKEDASEDEIRDLLLGSVLKDNELYKYTKHKEVLESIFEKQEVD